MYTYCIIIITTTTTTTIIIIIIMNGHNNVFLLGAFAKLNASYNDLQYSTGGVQVGIGTRVKD